MVSLVSKVGTFQENTACIKRRLSFLSMLFNRFVCHSTLLAQADRATRKMTSTLVGESGRRYTRGQVLQRHRTDPALSVFMAK